jgi:ABC-type transport system substrate-binding protein
MYKKVLIAIVVLAMISMMFAPAFAWEYPDGSHDTKYEKFGPRADSLLINLYSSEISEWETGLEGREIDITDWPLDSLHKDRYTSPPWNSTLKVLGYGAEFGFYTFDLNQNNNTYLGNPPNPARPNPRWPNPMGYTVAQSGIIHDGGYPLRHAIAHCVNRSDIINHIGYGKPLCTIVPPSLSKYHNPSVDCHPYNLTEASRILDESGMFPFDAIEGRRFWDRNRNGIKDLGESLALKLVARIDHQPRDIMGTLLAIELEKIGVHVDTFHLTITAARIQVYTNADFHIYTGSASVDLDLTYLLGWNWDYTTYCGCNKDAYNHAAEGVQYANTQDDAVVNARIAQEVFCDAVMGVPVLYIEGFKAMSRTYVGHEDPYEGEKWYGIVNQPGFGIDNRYTFMNMHTSCHENGGTIRYGFRTTGIRQLNPIYAESYWDNTVLDLIGYESLLARDPYALSQHIPWVCKTFQISTYDHPVYGTCTKIVFTLRNDVYWADGTQLTIADIAFTFLEVDDILASRGLAPPWWISNVKNILSFSILDPLNFEVLLDVKSIFALGWIGGNRILPKHIWKPIVTGAIAPKSGLPWDPTTFAPDPNLIASGPWRLDEYIPENHIVLTANRPGTVVDTGITIDPNANSQPVTSPKGYFRLNPIYVDIHADSYKAKINCKESVPPCNPQKWMIVNFTIMDHNLWMEHFMFEDWPRGSLNRTDPVGAVLHGVWPPFPPDQGGIQSCKWQIISWIDQNSNSMLDPCDIVLLMPLDILPPPGFTGLWFHLQDITWDEINSRYLLTVGQVLEVIKRVYVDGQLQLGPEHEYLKPCIPVTETVSLNLSKCMHVAKVAKYVTTGWFLCPNNAIVPNPYIGWINVTWPIWVTIKEDVTGSYYVNTQLPAPDCKVDLKDVFKVGKAFGSVPGDAKWDSVCDIVPDYRIDLKDYFAVAKKFGRW